MNRYIIEICSSAASVQQVIMATVTEAVKETLVGTTREPEPSQEIRAAFDKFAKRDEASGEEYMTEEDFVDAIAPINEDYVSGPSLLFCDGLWGGNANPITDVA